MQRLTSASLLCLRRTHQTHRPLPRSLATSRGPLPLPSSPPEPSPVFVKVFRIAAVGTVAVTAWNVLPLVDAITVPHAIALTQAKEGLMIRSGARRMSAAMRRRPSCRADFYEKGAVAVLTDTAVRDSFSSRSADGDVRDTRDAIFVALLEITEVEGAPSKILANKNFMTVVEAEMQLGSANARILWESLKVLEMPRQKVNKL